MPQYNYISGKSVQSAPALDQVFSSIEMLENPANFGRAVYTANKDFFCWALTLYNGMTVAVGTDLYIWNGGKATMDQSSRINITNQNLELPIGDYGWKKINQGGRAEVDNDTIMYNEGQDQTQGTDDDQLYVNSVNGGTWK